MFSNRYWPVCLAGIMVGLSLNLVAPVAWAANGTNGTDDQVPLQVIEAKGMVKPRHFSFSSMDSSINVQTHNGLCVRLSLDEDENIYTTDNMVRCANGASNIMLESPDRRFIYISDEVSSNGVKSAVMHRYSTEGSPAEINRTTGKTTISLEGLTSVDTGAISHDGQFMFVISREQSALVGFERNLATGQLSPFAIWRAEGPDAVAGLHGIQELAVSPDSHWLAVSGKTSHSILWFKRVEADGVSTWVLDDTLSAPELKRPRGVAFDQGSHYLFAAFAKSMSLATYSLDDHDRWQKTSTVALKARPDKVWVENNTLIVALQENIILKQKGRLLFFDIQQDGLLKEMDSLDGINPADLPNLEQVVDVRIKNNTLFVSDINHLYARKAKQVIAKTDAPANTATATATTATTSLTTPSPTEATVPAAAMQVGMNTLLTLLLVVVTTAVFYF